MNEFNSFKAPEEMTFEEFEFSRWIDLTKKMFRDFPAILVYKEIDECLAKVSDKQWEKGFPKRIFNEEQYPRIIRSKGKNRQIIDSKLKITNIAKSFGLEVDKKGRCLCPFHEDNNPSLGLNDEKNIFHCFGCGAKGDIVEFNRLMKEAKNDKQKRK